MCRRAGQALSSSPCGTMQQRNETNRSASFNTGAVLSQYSSSRYRSTATTVAAGCGKQLPTCISSFRRRTERTQRAGTFARLHKSCFCSRLEEVEQHHTIRVASSASSCAAGKDLETPVTVNYASLCALCLSVCLSVCLSYLASRSALVGNAIGSSPSFDRKSSSIGSPSRS